MTQRAFEELVTKLERYARHQPKAYLAEVTLLAALGYLYFVLLAIALTTGIGVMVYYIFGKIAALVIVFASLLLSASWVLLCLVRIEFANPKGYAIQKKDAPQLFSMLDELILELKAPHLHHVVITDQFNASIVQTPRFGLIGSDINYLMIGLPLMKSLSPEHFRAVLAHELAHLSRNHSKIACWIYRVRQMWTQLIEDDDIHGSAGILFNYFLRRYAPFFNAYSFVLARSNEFVADKAAAKVVGARTLADALIATRVKANFIDNTFWPNLYLSATKVAKPPLSPHSLMFHQLPAVPLGAEAEKWFDEALAEKPSYRNTHPTLISRLSSLGFIPVQTQQDCLPISPLPLPEFSSINAADFYIGHRVEYLTVCFDEEWQAKIAESWKERYDEAQKAKRDLEHLCQKSGKGELTLDELWHFIKLIIEYRDESKAIYYLDKLLKLEPNNAKANFTLGEILLKENNYRGIQLLNKAMANEPELTEKVCEAAYYFLKKNGRVKEAMHYRRKGDEYRDMHERAQIERETITANDRFQYHALSANELHHIKTQLANFSAVKEAYLLRKTCSMMPEKPLYILAIRPWSWLNEPYYGKLGQQTIGEIASNILLPGEVQIVILNPKQRPLLHAIKVMSSAKIYAVN